MSNFIFLKKKNGSFYKVISEAEKLFRDEYFEQVVVQTRRFAENICRDLLEDKVSLDDTFDSMINKIKDNSYGNTRMKEFSEDLFFLKKHGNSSAHSIESSITPEIALECLERAYEVSVFYYHMKYGADKKIDKTLFSEELLMTGKKPPKKSLKDKYEQEINNHRKTNKESKVKNTKSSKKTKQKKEDKQKAEKVKPSRKKRNFMQKEKQGMKSCLVSLVLFLVLGGLFIYLKFYQ